MASQCRPLSKTSFMMRKKIGTNDVDKVQYMPVPRVLGAWCMGSVGVLQVRYALEKDISGHTAKP